MSGGASHSRLARMQQGHRRDATAAGDHERDADARIWTAGAAGGRPLDPLLRGRMEQRFQKDFSAVRIHDDPDAAASAKSLSAKAYTFGKDIFFGQGRFAPDTRDGNRLIAHELAHVVQQQRGGATPALDANSSLEQAAASAADAAVSGAGPVAVQGASGVGVARDKDGKDDDDDVADPNTLVQLRQQRQKFLTPKKKADDTIRINDWKTKGKGTLAEVTVPHALYSGWDWNHVGGGFETGSSRTSLARPTPYSKDPSAGIDFIVENVKTGRLVIGEQKAVGKNTFDNATATTKNLETNLNHAVTTLEAKLKSGQVKHPDAIQGLEATIARLKATQQAIQNKTDLPEGVVFELTNLGGKGEKIGKNHIDNLAEKYKDHPEFLEHLLSRTFVRDPELAKKSGRDPSGKPGTDTDPDIVPAKDILTDDAKDTLERIRQKKSPKEWEAEKKAKKAEEKKAEEAETKRKADERAAETKRKADEKLADRKRKADERAAEKQRRADEKAQEKQQKKGKPKSDGEPEGTGRKSKKSGKRPDEAGASKPEKKSKAKPKAAGEMPPPEEAAPRKKSGSRKKAAATPQEPPAKQPAEPSTAPQKKAGGKKKSGAPSGQPEPTVEPAKKKAATKGKAQSEAPPADRAPAPAKAEERAGPAKKAPTENEAPKKPAAAGDHEDGGSAKKPGGASDHPGGKKPTTGEKIDAGAGKAAHAMNEAAALLRAYDAYEENKDKGTGRAALAAAKTYLDNTNVVMGGIANMEAKRKDGQDPVEAVISTLGETGAGFLVPGSGIDQAINGLDNLVGAGEEHSLKNDPNAEAKSKKASLKTGTEFAAGLTPSKMFSQTIGAGARAYYDIGKFAGGDASGVDKFGDDAAKGKLGMVLQPLGMTADFLGNLGSGEGAGKALDKTLDKAKGSTIEKLGSASGDAFFELGQSKEAKSGKYGSVVQGWAAISSIGTDMINDKGWDHALNNAVVSGGGGVLETAGNAMGDAAYAGVERTKKLLNEDLPQAKAAIKEKATEIKAEAVQTYESAKQAAGEYKDKAVETYEAAKQSASEYKDAAADKYADAKKRLKSAFTW